MKLTKNGRTAVTRGFPRLPQGREIPTDYWVPFVNLRVLGVYCFKIAPRTTQRFTKEEAQIGSNA
jgi:hypothetical protein